MTAPIALVVDDEEQMVSIVAFALETQGFQCLTAATARGAWEQLHSHNVDIAVIDVMLPDSTGISLAKRIRSAGLNTPIILLTALSEESDRIAGLLAGADDYVSKPFSPRELALRAQAVARRARPSSNDPDALVSAGELTADLRASKAYWRGIRIDLATTEFRVLAVLLEHAGEVVTYSQLLNEAWATSVTAGGREMIKTAVYRLRKKMIDVGADAETIESIRGRGYRLVTIV